VTRTPGTQFRNPPGASQSRVFRDQWFADRGRSMHQVQPRRNYPGRNPRLHSAGIACDNTLSTVHLAPKRRRSASPAGLQKFAKPADPRTSTAHRLSTVISARHYAWRGHGIRGDLGRSLTPSRTIPTSQQRIFRSARGGRSGSRLAIPVVISWKAGNRTDISADRAVNIPSVLVKDQNSRRRRRVLLRPTDVPHKLPAARTYDWHQTSGLLRHHHPAITPGTGGGRPRRAERDGGSRRSSAGRAW
jgi:hypothetical protein